MKTVLLTGGAGFFGGIVKNRLLDAGYRCVSIDLCPDPTVHTDLTTIQADIRDVRLLDRIYTQNRFDANIPRAAMLAHAVKDKRLLWESNVDGTRNIAEMARRHSVPKLVFTSS